MCHFKILYFGYNFFISLKKKKSIASDDAEILLSPAPPRNIVSVASFLRFWSLHQSKWYICFTFYLFSSDNLIKYILLSLYIFYKQKDLCLEENTVYYMFFINCSLSMYKIGIIKPILQMGKLRLKDFK